MLTVDFDRHRTGARRAPARPRRRRRTARVRGDAPRRARHRARLLGRRPEGRRRRGRRDDRRAAKSTYDQWAGVVNGDALDLPFASNTFDRVIVSEVLEHVWDDERTLTEIARVLRPGGRIAATVPTRWPERVSWALNWHYHDTPGGHVRIYRQHELELKLERAGLLPARLAPRARVPLAVLVAEVRVRAREHRRRARPALPRLLVHADREATRAGRGSPSGRSTRCSARASCCTARRSHRRWRNGGSEALPDHELPEVDGIITRAAGRADGRRDRVGAAARRQHPVGARASHRSVEPGRGRDGARRRQPLRRGRARVRLADAACSTTPARWHAYYVGDEVKEHTLDTNVTCYVANGVWHHYLCTRDSGFLEDDVPGRRARDRLRARQPAPDRRDRVGRRSRAASKARARCSPDRRASTRRCAARSPPPNASAANGPTGSCRSARSPSRSRTGPSASSTRTAGRWTGTTRSSSACSAGTRPKRGSRRSGTRSSRPDRGVRCVSDQPWVTAAETCELVMALDAIGLHDRARTLFEWVQFLRHDDGSYWTGMNFADDRYDELGRVLHRRAADVEQRRGRARRQRARRHRARPRACSAAKGSPAGSPPRS